MSHWLEDVYRKDGERLFRLSWLILRDVALAEDAVHIAFVQLAGLKKPPECRSAYVYRCVRNAAIDERRRRGRRATETLIGNEASSSHFHDESRLLLEELLLTLSESQREVIELRLRLAFTFTEISAMLGEPLSTVSSRYQRAINVLRERAEVNHG